MNQMSIDMIGERHGRLVVLSKFKVINESTYWTCLCDCGNIKNVSRTALLNGTVSCGCFRLEQVKKANTTHNLTHHPLYRVWWGIKERCYNKNAKNYRLYGGLGVKMCAEWKNSFNKFYEWCLDNGWEKGMEIDKDIKGGKIYSPKNCSIVTAKVNNRFKSGSIFITHNGITKHLIDWCEEYGLNVRTIRARYNRGSKDPLKLPSKNPHKNSIFIN